MEEFFATTGKGIEELLAGELRALGVTVAAVESGGVRFTGDMTDCWRANLWLRTANRVLLPLAVFPCDSPQALYERVRELDWPALLTPDMTLAVDCNLRDSAMTHSGFVALKTKDAIVDALRDSCGRRPSVDTRNPDVRVNVHLVKNLCTVSLDSSGDPLDRRGYRLERTDAPLRETLAAALVELAGWDGSVPLADPMCGSGTILIEAALKAARRAPGMMRDGFGFQRWRNFDPLRWATFLAEAREAVISTLAIPVLGCDRQSRAVEVARQNARRAGVGEMLTLERRAIREFSPPPGPGVLIFNPPYGHRLSDEELLKPLYREIGDVMKKRCTGYTAYLFTASPELAKCVGLKASRRFVLFNGPLECRLLKYELY